MNAYQCELNGLKFDHAYNRTPVRVAQGKNRADKTNYKPTVVRAKHHIGPTPKR